MCQLLGTKSGARALIPIIGSYALSAGRSNFARKSLTMIPMARAVGSDLFSVDPRSIREAASRHHVHVEPEEDSVRAGASGRRIQEIISSGRQVAVLCCQVGSGSRVAGADEFS